MALVEIDKAYKHYGSLVVLNGLSLDIEEHQVVCLIGPSGCGKSTLLRCINRLETIQKGEIRLHGDRITGPGVDLDVLRREIGIVFQGYNLFPHMSVIENITLGPLKVLGWIEPKPATREWRSCPASVWRTRRTNIRTVFRAGSSNVSPLCVR
jgi:polar amino acid transport system ATP-binding protein